RIREHSRRGPFAQGKAHCAEVRSYQRQQTVGRERLGSNREVDKVRRGGRRPEGAFSSSIGGRLGSPGRLPVFLRSSHSADTILICDRYASARSDKELAKMERPMKRSTIAMSLLSIAMMGGCESL